jgi:hypothetical protein
VSLRLAWKKTIDFHVAQNEPGVLGLADRHRAEIDRRVWAGHDHERRALRFDSEVDRRATMAWVVRREEESARQRCTRRRGRRYGSDDRELRRLSRSERRVARRNGERRTERRCVDDEGRGPRILHRDGIGPTLGSAPGGAQVDRRRGDDGERRGAGVARRGIDRKREVVNRPASRTRLCNLPRPMRRRARPHDRRIRASARPPTEPSRSSTR